MSDRSAEQRAGERGVMTTASFPSWQDCTGLYSVDVMLISDTPESYWPSMLSIDATDLDGSITADDARVLAAALVAAADACDADTDARRSKGALFGNSEQTSEPPCDTCGGTGCPCFRSRDWQSIDLGCNYGCDECGLNTCGKACDGGDK